MNRILAVALACAALCFCSSAFADDGNFAIPAALAGWSGLALLVTTLLAYGLRRFAPASHFFHTDAGAILLAAIMAVLNGATASIQAHGLNLQALTSSAIAALFSVLAMSNPSISAGESDMKKSLQAFLPFVLLPLALAIAGCTYCADPAHAGEPKCIAEQVSIDCGVAAVERAALAALPAVEARINGQTVDWEALGNEELQVGLPAVACAVEMAEKLSNSGAATDAPASQYPPGLVADVVMHRDEIRKNAADYYAARRVKFKPRFSASSAEDLGGLSIWLVVAL